MAGKAELVLFRHDHPVTVGTVRVMAGEAQSLLERDMGRSYVRRFHEAAVTLRAEV